jgi:hypothetical protein
MARGPGVEVKYGALGCDNGVRRGASMNEAHYTRESLPYRAQVPVLDLEAVVTAGQVLMGRISLLSGWHKRDATCLSRSLLQGRNTVTERMVCDTD